MEFARELVCSPSVTTQSNIRYVLYVPPDCDNSAVPSPSTFQQKKSANHKIGGGEEVVPKDDEDANTNSTTDDHADTANTDDDAALDHLVAKAANVAASQLFGVSPAEAVNCRHYPERLLPQHSIIQQGDLVVIQESFDKLDFVYVTPGQIFHNRNGDFPHTSFLNLPFGSMVRSSNNRGYGFLYLLKPTPELWVRSLNHRTQVIHELDSSMIVHQLHLKPNMVVIESGTGSTALSHALLRTLAPHGHLHTLEFNATRASAARKELEQNGIPSHLVTVYHTDACQSSAWTALPSSGQDCADAIVLDLPEPWRAIPYAALALKLGARIATYSPCIEQTQQTVETLQTYGFHSIRTMEYRLREHYVDTIELLPPPLAKRPKPAPHDPKYWESEGWKASKTTAAETTPAPAVQTVNESTLGGTGTAVRSDNGEDETGETESALESDGPLNPSPVTVSVPVAPTSERPSSNDDNDNGGGSDHHNEAETTTATASANAVALPIPKKLVVARPFGMMRGHTAFLTFATLGHPKPTKGRANATTMKSSSSSTADPADTSPAGENRAADASSVSR